MQNIDFDDDDDDFNMGDDNDGRDFDLDFEFIDFVLYLNEDLPIFLLACCNLCSITYYLPVWVQLIRLFVAQMRQYIKGSACMDVYLGFQFGTSFHIWSHLFFIKPKYLVNCNLVILSHLLRMVS